jgi:hypothetical protein
MDMAKWTVSRRTAVALVIATIVIVVAEDGKALAGPPDTGLLLVTESPHVVTYSQSGTALQDINVPDPDSPPGEIVRDITTDPDGNIAIFSGTFAPYLTIYHVADSTWEHHTHPGWSLIDSGYSGGIATSQDYVFVTDVSLNGDENGIVRFDRSDYTSERFAAGTDFIDLNLGLDGLLYALYPAGGPPGTHVNVYNPNDMTLIRTVALGSAARGVAASAVGELFVSTASEIHRLAPDGALLQTFDTGFIELRDPDIAADGTLVAISRLGDIVLTDTSMSSMTSFEADKYASFVGFATHAPCVDIDQDGLCNGPDADDDNDGCADTRELATNPVIGGQRDPLYFWDFFDVPTGPSLLRDGAITIADLSAVLLRYGSTDSGPGAFDRYSDPLSLPNLSVGPSGSRENYHPAFDRGPPPPTGAPWHLLPADGSISITDLAAVVAQFGRNCS